MQVTVLSPLNSYPTLQLRDRTVPVETGKSGSASMLVQVVFRPVQSEMVFKHCNKYSELQSSNKNAFSQWRHVGKCNKTEVKMSVKEPENLFEEK